MPPGRSAKAVPGWLGLAQLPPSGWPVPAAILPGFPWTVDVRARAAAQQRPGPPAASAPPAGSTDLVLSRAGLVFAALVQDLDRLRDAAGFSTRRWATAAGIAPSSVDALLHGRTWSSPATLGQLAAVTGARLVLQPPGPNAPRVPRLRARERSLAGPPRQRWEHDAGADPAALAAAWYNAAVATARWQLRAAGVNGVLLQRTRRLRPATWSQLRPTAPQRWASTQVLLAVADAGCLTLAVQPGTRAWPLMPWEQHLGDVLSA